MLYTPAELMESAKFWAGGAVVLAVFWSMVVIVARAPKVRWVAFCFVVLQLLLGIGSYFVGEWAARYAKEREDALKHTESVLRRNTDEYRAAKIETDERIGELTVALEENRKDLMKMRGERAELEARLKEKTAELADIERKLLQIDPPRR
jgi:hypothetical protein